MSDKEKIKGGSSLYYSTANSPCQSLKFDSVSTIQLRNNIPLSSGCGGASYSLSRTAVAVWTHLRAGEAKILLKITPASFMALPVICACSRPTEVRGGSLIYAAAPEPACLFGTAFGMFRSLRVKLPAKVPRRYQHDNCVSSQQHKDMVSCPVVTRVSHTLAMCP